MAFSGPLAHEGMPTCNMTLHFLCLPILVEKRPSPVEKRQFLEPCPTRAGGMYGPLCTSALYIHTRAPIPGLHRVPRPFSLSPRITWPPLNGHRQLEGPVPAPTWLPCLWNQCHAPAVPRATSFTRQEPPPQTVPMLPCAIQSLASASSPIKTRAGRSVHSSSILLAPGAVTRSRTLESATVP